MRDGLQDQPVIPEQLAQKLDSVLAEWNAQIHFEAPPSLDIRMAGAAVL